MGIKIAFSGLVLATVLILPAMMRGTKPPAWFIAVVLVTGFSGISMFFAGLLLAIWE